MENINEASVNCLLGASLIPKESAEDYVIIDDIDFSNFPSDFDVRVKNVFLSKEYMIKVLKFMAVRRHFSFRAPRSSNTRYTIVCKMPGCPWKLVVRACVKSNIWIVRKYHHLHSHNLETVSTTNDQASTVVISEYIKSLFEIGCPERITPKDIKNLIRRDLSIDISYYTAWKARHVTVNEIRGPAEDSYSLLPFIGDMMKAKNPGTVIDYQVKHNGEFLYFFMSIGASIHGWPYCRPVISIDGTFLKNQFGGTLLLAAAVDADNHIFPLALAIVDSENDSSWYWFLENLRKSLGTREGLVIVSDRNSSIAKGVQNVFPTADHAICMYHLSKNLKVKFPFVALEAFFFKCAKSYTVNDFEKNFDALNPAVKEYLLEADPKKWSRALFPGKRFNVMTTNISESLNSVLRVIREWPVSCMVLGFRDVLQDWFFQRTNSSQSMMSPLTHSSFELFVNNEESARTMEVKFINFHEFEVVHHGKSKVVNVLKKECSCLKWQMDDFPCYHAFAALWKSNLNPYHYISPYYSKASFISTYSCSVYPLDDKSTWVIPPALYPSILPPTVKRRAGRPKKKRIRSCGEVENPVHCGNCGRLGHNKRTCRDQ